MARGTPTALQPKRTSATVRASAVAAEKDERYRARQRQCQRQPHKPRRARFFLFFIFFFSYPTPSRLAVVWFFFSASRLLLHGALLERQGFPARPMWPSLIFFFFTPLPPSHPPPPSHMHSTRPLFRLLLPGSLGGASFLPVQIYTYMYIYIYTSGFLFFFWFLFSLLHHR